MKQILVIKLGALGDIFNATSAFEAIRDHHKADHLTLLTRKPYENIAKKFGYFDDIWIDNGAKFFQIKLLWTQRQKLLSRAFQRVYDLQMVDRTNLYYQLLRPHCPEWVGAAWGASHRKLFKKYMYHQDRYKELLALADISSLPSLNLTRLAGDANLFPIKFPFVLFAAGASAAHRHRKCWPLEYYAQVAIQLVQEGLTPVIVGTSDENHQLIVEKCPEAIDLTGKTTIMDIITLATNAAFAIGNDTGPIHIAACCNCPVLPLHFGQNDPAIFGARGIFYHHPYAKEKAQLSVDEVCRYLPELIDKFKDRVTSAHTMG